MGTATLYFPMGLFKKKKAKKVEVPKTAIQNLNEQIKTYSATVSDLERLKPRLAKLVTHYKKQIGTYNYAHNSGVTLRFAKGIINYPDGFYAFADKLGLNVQPVCSSGYDYDPEPTFIVSAKSK